MPFNAKHDSIEPAKEQRPSLDWRQVAVRYAGVITSVVVAVLVRLPFHAALDGKAPFFTFLPAIVYSAWLLGWTGGLLSTTLSVAIAFQFIFLSTSHHNVLSEADRTSLFVFVAISIAISAMGHAQHSARKRTEQSEALKSTILEVALDGIITYSADGRITEFNPAAERIFGYTRSEALGRLVEELIIPPSRRRLGRLGFDHYESDGGSAIFGRRIEVEALRKDGDEFPIELAVISMAERAGFVAYFSDISERKRAEREAAAAFRRETILNRVSQAIRLTSDPREVQEIALEAMAEALGVDRCLSIALDKERDLVSFVAEWRRPNLPSLLGEYSLAAFDVDLDEIFPASAPNAVSDIRSGPFSQKSIDILSEMGIRALLDVPMATEGKVVAVLGVHMAEEPRDWKPEEILFVEAVAAQMRSIAEAARLLTGIQARAEREALINRIGGAIRAAVDPAQIQEIAVRHLGEALGVDRCYFAIYDLANDQVTVASEWRREDLPAIKGVHPFTNTAEMFQELYRSTPTSVIPDARNSSLSAQTRENMAALRLRSRVSVALYETETSMATLTAAMADVRRDWTQDEVTLIEAVATQTRSAVEMARVQQREHLIAEQLQAALQPRPPSSVAGLDIRMHYKPALDEAGVGGDFYDVFSAAPGITFLIVGDLSGKGLAAASQVATVRNMLRFALYNESALSAAVSSVSRTLSENDLLTGFATLFVGRWDARTRTLCYVNCGQEPGLIRRVDGEITELSPTGPVLGMYDGGVFEERAVRLERGDVLAVFTDGLTEVGPTRSEMLGVSGVSALLQGSKLTGDSEALVRSLIDEVNAFARGGVRDDQCLLVGAIES
ncbi:MAG: SpoIIE family protein phosphatase [Capsulimonas sp.]|uniref:SpoIIE family protein phosphatase n=1 Tax=Capsulimonas sp. TaxID=2494211 RepID=UPI003264C579